MTRLRLATAMYTRNQERLERMNIERAERHGYPPIPLALRPFNEADAHIRELYFDYADAVMEELGLVE